jgi:hypothetical protein
MIKRTILAVLAAIAMLLVPAAVGGAATPSCGPGCVDVFSAEFGSFLHPMFAVDTLRRGERVGQPIILFRNSNADPAEDFAAEFNGTTSDFFAAGLVSAAVTLHYGCKGTFPGTGVPCPAGATDAAAFEAEYAPYGVDSGLCVGVASTAFQGEGVSLQPCGVSAKTVWIVDTNDQTRITSAGLPLINGSDTNFSHPFVLTYPPDAFPTDRPRPQLVVTNLTGFTQPGGIFPVISSIDSDQLWSADFGVLP